jgi:hypothetical protein
MHFSADEFTANEISTKNSTIINNGIEKIEVRRVNVEYCKNNCTILNARIERRIERRRLDDR